jgi:uncharacterized membrane protein HdeD (DUF308 family)
VISHPESRVTIGHKVRKEQQLESPPPNLQVPERKVRRPGARGRAASSGRIAYRVTFARGVLALTLGVAMLVQPEKTSDNLATYMGVFWALTGVVSIRSALAGERTRGIPLVSGCAGVVAGVATLFRGRLDDVAAESLFVYVLGTVILLTGVAHVLGGFTTGDELDRRRSRSSVLLGMMEIALGLLFLIGSVENSRAAYWAAGVWALTGGVILIGDALLLRRRLRSATPA